jgi:hypothetical protein
MTFPHLSSHEYKDKTKPPFQGSDESIKSGEEQKQPFTGERVWDGCNNIEFDSKNNEGDISEDGYTQQQRGLSVLDRVLSRTSVVYNDPGPPPDGGFWAWASGKLF